MGGEEVVIVHDEGKLPINREDGNDYTYNNYTYISLGGVTYLITPTGYFIKEYWYAH